MANQNFGDFVTNRTPRTPQGADLVAVVTGNTTYQATLTDVVALGGGGGGGGVSADSGQNIFIGGGGTAIDIDELFGDGCDNITLGAGSVFGATPTEFAGANLDDATGNVLVGGSAGANLTDGGWNTFIGDTAGYHGTTANHNVGIGRGAGYTLTNGFKNVGIGLDALGFATSADNNVAIGTSAGSYIDTGSDNVAIGDGAGPAFGTSGLSNTVAIGTNAAPKESNVAVIGGMGSGGVSLGWSGTTAPADASINSSSGYLYWDFTNGAPLLKAKLKTANGTVVTKTITWT